MFIIEQRKCTEVNTDPQRRCYNGCHFSSEFQWGAWDWLETRVKPNDVDERLEFWRGLNKYAVDARGKGASSEFRVVEREEV